MNDKQIEKYLKQSTRGLWGRKKAEVREELETHIEGRFNAYLIAGCSEADAVDKTLAELGRPSVVSTGMARVYTLPIMAGSGLMLALCCALTILVLNASTAQTLQVSDTFPADECLESEVCGNGIWISLEELKQAFEPQHIKVTESNNLMVLEFPNKKTFSISSLASTRSVFVSGKTVNSKPGYITLGDLMKALASRRDTAITVKGWDTPTITIDQVSLQMVTDGKGISGSDFYGSYIIDGVTSAGLVNFDELIADGQGFAIPSSPGEPMGSITHNAGFNIGAKEGTVYAIVSIQKAHFGVTDSELQDINLGFYFDVAPASADGKVNLDVSKEFELDSSLDIGKAVLVRLSGEFPSGKFYEVVPPDQITLE